MIDDFIDGFPIGILAGVAIGIAAVIVRRNPRGRLRP